MDELAKLEPIRQAVVLLPLAVVLITCAYTDYRDRKVYTKITYPALFIGLACNGIALGLDGLLGGLGAAAFTLVFGLLLLAIRVIGAGDIKLLVVVGAFLGFQGLAEVTFYSVLVGAVGGLIAATFNGYLLDMLKRMGRFLRGVFRTILYRSGVMLEKMERDERSWIPFAIAILFGGVFTWTDAMYGWPELWAPFVRAWQP